MVVNSDWRLRYTLMTEGVSAFVPIILAVIARPPLQFINHLFHGRPRLLFTRRITTRLKLSRLCSPVVLLLWPLTSPSLPAQHGTSTRELLQASGQSSRVFH